jgi:hypothetical protein
LDARKIASAGRAWLTHAAAAVDFIDANFSRAQGG